MSETRISAFNTLGEAFNALWREKQLAFLLVTFISLITLIIMWPFMEWYLEFIPAMLEREEPTLEQIEATVGELDYIYIWILPTLFLSLATLVLWSRAVVGGTAVAFEGRIRALLRRSMWMLWRYICGIGWMIAAGAVFMLLFVVLGMVFGIGGSLLSGSEGGAGSGLLTVVIMILYIIFIFVLLGLSLLMTISFHGEARDFRLPIHKSFAAMDDKILGATGVLVLLVLVFYLGYFLLAVLLFTLLSSPTVWVAFLGAFILFLFGNIMNFIWVAYGALYASKLVPELKG